MLKPLLLAAIFFAPRAQAYHEGCVGPHELTAYRFIPDCEGINRDPNGKEWPFKTNEMGLIAEPDYPRVPPPGTLRILVLGPSTLVNFTPEVGIIPAMEAELRRMKLKFGKFRKVELINGAMAGFDIVQSYLLAKPLLERYSPHVVLFQSALESFSLQQANDHFASPEFDERGLSVKMGQQQPFWPIPNEHSRDFWMKFGPNAPKISVRLRGLRLAMYKLCIRIGLGRFRDTSGFSVYGNLHLGYLQGMRELVEKKNARFYVVGSPSNVDVEAAFWSQLKYDAWYKPEWYAAKMLRWPHMKNAHYAAVTQAMFANFPMLPSPAVELGPTDMYPGDYHPAPDGLSKIGRAWAREIGPRIAADLSGAR